MKNLSLKNRFFASLIILSLALLMGSCEKETDIIPTINDALTYKSTCNVTVFTINTTGCCFDFKIQGATDSWVMDFGDGVVVRGADDSVLSHCYPDDETYSVTFKCGGISQQLIKGNCNESGKGRIPYTAYFD